MLGNYHYHVGLPSNILGVLSPDCLTTLSSGAAAKGNLGGSSSGRLMSNIFGLSERNLSSASDTQPSWGQVMGLGPDDDVMASKSGHCGVGWRFFDKHLLFSIYAPVSGNRSSVM
ncbi:hypothetical protein AVEN_99812-1 [Araneus ventricosus]|uniref:Uncharacterized protein n=1 Tax=Araneus ventricosus TaxID=182803 RepID=A0A4Y2V5L0_ARAVE|nr:hypothetical protein AVEN_99812-1 [Araneus ventricosus]